MIFNNLLLKPTRRLLRARQTPEESLLWEQLRNRRLGGFRFVRQFSVDQFVIDFYCPERLLGVEVDGSQHETDEGRKQDSERAELLAERNIRLIRFRNREVRDTLHTVLNTIHEALRKKNKKGTPS